LKISSFSDIVKPRGGELGEVDKIAANCSEEKYLSFRRSRNFSVHLLIQSVVFEKEILLWK